MQYLCCKGLFFAVGSVLEIELLKRKEKEKTVPEELKNFFDMWREEGFDIPGNYGFGKVYFLNVSTMSDLILLSRSIETWLLYEWK